MSRTLEPRLVRPAELHYASRTMLAGLLSAPIVHRHEWAPGLITLRLGVELPSFEPGQFVNLGLPHDGTVLRRPYSLASAPGQHPEFYLTRVEDGALTPALFDLPLGTELFVEQKAQGFFTLRYVPECADLWLVATGTGMGPFISMLRSGELWDRFPRINVVHGVRRAAELGYREELLAAAAARPGKLRYVPLVSREPNATEALLGRITTKLADGELERAAETPITDKSHLMLCGNPEMIRDVIEALHARGLRKHRVRQPGHYTLEKYW